MAKPDTQQLKGVMDIINDIIKQSDELPKNSAEKIGSLNNVIKEASMVIDVINSVALKINELPENTVERVGSLNNVIKEASMVIDVINSVAAKIDNSSASNIQNTIIGLSNYFNEFIENLQSIDINDEVKDKLLALVDNMKFVMNSIDEIVNTANNSRMSLDTNANIAALNDSIGDIFNIIESVVESINSFEGNIDVDELSKNISFITSSTLPKILELLNDISNFISSIEPISVEDAKIKKLAISRSFSLIKKMMDEVNDLFDNHSFDTTLIHEFILSIYVIKQAVTILNEYVNSIPSVGVKRFIQCKYSLWAIKRIVRSTIRMVNKLSDTIDSNFNIHAFAASIMSLRFAITQVKELIEDLRGIKTGILFILNRKIKKAFKTLINIMKLLAKMPDAIDTIIKVKAFTVSLKILNEATGMINEIINVILKITLKMTLVVILAPLILLSMTAFGIVITGIAMTISFISVTLTAAAASMVLLPAAMVVWKLGMWAINEIISSIGSLMKQMLKFMLFGWIINAGLRRVKKITRKIFNVFGYIAQKGTRNLVNVGIAVVITNVAIFGVKLILKQLRHMARPLLWLSLRKKLIVKGLNRMESLISRLWKTWNILSLHTAKRKYSLMFKTVAMTLMAIKSIKLIAKSLRHMMSLKFIFTYKLNKKFIDRVAHLVNYLYRRFSSIIRRSNAIMKSAIRLTITVVATRITVNNLRSLAGNLIKLSLIRFTKKQVISINKKIKNLLDVVKYLVRKVNRFVKRRSQLKRIVLFSGIVKMIELTVKSMVKIALILMLATPVLGMFAILSPIIILAFWAFTLVLKVIIRTASKLANKRVLLGILALLGVLYMLNLILLALVAIAFLGSIVVQRAGVILGSLLILALVSLGVLLIGSILALATPIMPAILIGIAGMTVAIWLITLAAVALWVLGMINIDQEAVLKNVDIIFDTVRQIISRLWESMLPEDEDPGFWGGMLNMLVKGISMLLGIPLLLATLVVTVAILLIATTLRILQTINLDKTKILRNVDIIFDTVLDIIDRLWNTSMENAHNQSNGLFDKLLGFVSPKLQAFWSMFAGAAFMVVTLIAVGAILAIAAMLRVLETLNLRPDLIKRNVKTIFDVVASLLEAVSSAGTLGEGTGDGLIEMILRVASPNLAAIWRVLTATVFLLAATIAIGAVWGIGKLLTVIGNLCIEKEKIINNVETIFEIVGEILSAVAQNGSTGNGKGDGLIEIILDKFSPNLAAIWRALSSTIFLVLVTIAIGAVWGIGKLLEGIGNMDFDGDKIRDRITDIFECVNDILEGVNQAERTSNEGNGLFGSVIKFFLGDNFAAIINALMTVAFVALTFFAIAIVKGIAEKLAEIGAIDKDQLTSAKEKVDLIFDACNEIFDKVFEDRETEGEQGRPWYIKVLDIFGLGGIVEALVAIAQLGILFVVTGLVASLAEHLNTVASIEDSTFEEAPKKVSSIISAADTIRNEVLNLPPAPDPIDDEPWWKAPFKRIGRLMDEFAAFRRFNRLGEVMGMLGAIIGPLESIKNFDTKDFNEQEVKSKVQLIFGALNTVMDCVYKLATDALDDSADNAEDALDSMDDDLRDTLDMVIKVGEPLKKIGKMEIDYAGVEKQVNTILNLNKYIAGLRFKSMEKFSLGLMSMNTTLHVASGTIESLRATIDNISNLDDNTEEQVDKLLKIITSLSNTEFNDDRYNKNLKNIDELNKRLRSIVKVTDADVKNSKELTDNYIKFINRLDKADFQKLKTTEQMMRWWAQLSKSINGNFNGMAKAINKNVMPMLEKLDETMKGVSEVQGSIIDYLSADSTAGGGSINLGADSYRGSGLGSVGADGSGLGNFSLGAGTGDTTTPDVSGPQRDTTVPNPKQEAVGRRQVEHNDNKPDGSEENPFFVKIKS